MTDTGSREAEGLLVSSDLMFSSKVTGTASQLGHTCTVVASAEAAVRRLASGRVRYVIVDLALPGTTVNAIAAALPDQSRPRLVAFGSHVQTEKLSAALEAGCDEVLPRSRFSAELPKLLAAWSGAE